MKKTITLDEFLRSFGDMGKDIVEQMESAVLEEAHLMRDDLEDESKSIAEEYPEWTMEHDYAKDVAKSWKVQDMGKKGVVVGNTSKHANKFESGSRGAGGDIAPTFQLERAVDRLGRSGTSDIAVKTHENSGFDPKDYEN